MSAAQSPRSVRSREPSGRGESGVRPGSPRFAQLRRRGTSRTLAARCRPSFPNTTSPNPSSGRSVGPQTTQPALTTGRRGSRSPPLGAASRRSQPAAQPGVQSAEAVSLAGRATRAIRAVSAGQELATARAGTPSDDRGHRPSSRSRAPTAAPSTAAARSRSSGSQLGRPGATSAASGRAAPRARRSRVPAQTRPTRQIASRCVAHEHDIGVAGDLGYAAGERLRA